MSSFQITDKESGCVLSFSHQVDGTVLHMFCELNYYLTVVEVSQDIEYNLRNESN